MKKGWPQVPLGEILHRSDDWVSIDPHATYREVTVRLWGKGVTLRRECLGAEIKTDRRLRVRAGQFIASRIDARNGAFGLIPKELDGAVVTNDFPVFSPNTSRLYIPFLGWLSRTRNFVELCKAASEGTTNRVRLKEARFLTNAIPLPSIEEQRRIVARIDQLAAKIAQACAIRTSTVDEYSILIANAARQALESNPKWRRVALESVCAKIVDCLHSNAICSPDGAFPTVRSPDVEWGKINLRHAYRTDEHEYQRRTRRSELFAGDLVLVREGGGTGKAGLVEPGQKYSLGQRVMQIRPNRDLVEPQFFLHQWLSPLIFRDQIESGLKGSASPHLNIKALRRFDFVLPPIDEQRRIVAYLDGLSAKAEALQQLQQTATAELNALLPSVLDRAFKGGI